MIFILACGCLIVGGLIGRFHGVREHEPHAVKLLTGPKPTKLTARHMRGWVKK